MYVGPKAQQAAASRRSLLIYASQNGYPIISRSLAMRSVPTPFLWVITLWC